MEEYSGSPAASPTPIPVAVVVVNYGSSTLIMDNLTERAVADSGCMVVVVDNRSSDAERDAITLLCIERGWTLVAPESNEGFGAGVNRGVEAARERGAEVFIALNPDAVATGEVIRALAAEVAAHPDRMVSPLIKDSTGRLVYAGAQVSMRTGAIRRGWGDDRGEWRNWLTGACLAFHADAFDVVGGFAEDYFLYWEDVDLSIRAVRAGLELALRPDLVVLHDEGGTQHRSTRAKSDTYYYYNTRNRLLFARRHAPGRHLDFAASTPHESAQIWLRGGRRQVLTRPQGLLAAVRGSIVGLGRLWVPRPARARQGVRTGGPSTVLVAHPVPDLYGSDRVLLESVSAMVEGGHRVVAVLPHDGPLVGDLRAGGAEVVFLPAPVLRKSALSPRGFVSLAVESLRALPRARRLIRALAVDLVYVNTITNFLWLVAGRLAGVRVACHVHEAERSASAVIRRGVYAPLLLAHQLVVNSRYTLDAVTSAWPVLGRRATIVLNGVAGPQDPTPPRPVLDTVRLLFVGRLSPRKGPHVALEALEVLIGRGRSAHLELLGAVFAGYEWYEEDLRAWVAAHGMSEHVTFLGFAADVWRHVEDADIVLVPSIAEESFGNAAVEAFLAQRPLVVSGMGGLLEASAGYAWARPVPPADPVAIADAVDDLVWHWPDVVRTIPDDRSRAAQRHAPARYRADLLTSLFGAADEREPRGAFSPD